MKTRRLASTALLLVLGAALCGVLAFSQEGGQQPAPAPAPSSPGAGGGAAGPTTTTPSPGTTTPSPFPGQRDRQPYPQPSDQQRQQMPEMQRPIFLSGKVVMEDGTPPPDSIVIERVCNGVPRAEGYTDSKGRFSIQLGQRSAMTQDASYGATDPLFGDPSNPGGSSRSGMGGMGNPNMPGVSERDLMGCEIRAVLPGFRSEPVSLAGRRMFDNPDVGTIILHRLGNVEGTTISATSLQAPKDARKAFDKARDLLRKKKTPEAKKELEKAVEIYPKYATAWYELGQIYAGEKQPEQAKNAYSKALEADPKLVTPYLQLAQLAAMEGKWQEVADTSDRAIKLNPFDFPYAFFVNAVANYNLRKLDAAEKSVLEAQKLDKMHRIPKVEQLLGIILAERRDYNGAATALRNYMQFAPKANDLDAVKKQLGELERLSGSSAAATPAPVTPAP